MTCGYFGFQSLGLVDVVEHRVGVAKESALVRSVFGLWSFAGLVTIAGL